MNVDTHLIFCYNFVHSVRNKFWKGKRDVVYGERYALPYSEVIQSSVSGVYQSLLTFLPVSQSVWIEENKEMVRADTDTSEDLAMLRDWSVHV